MSSKKQGTHWSVTRTKVPKERREIQNVNVLSKRALTVLLASSLIIAEGSSFFAPIEANAYSKDNDRLLSAGQYATFALSTNGTLYSWGSDGNGMLGNGTSSEVSPAVVSLTNVVQVDAGSSHAMALRADGTVWGWGYNANGEIGDGGTSSSTVPKQVTHYSITDVRKVKAGDGFTMVLKNDGTLWGWGKNASGQLGTVNTIASKTPVQVKGVNGVGVMTDVVDFDLGTDHVLALTSDGSVYAWGEGNDGQLGLNSTGDRNAPTKITTLSNVVTISAGDARSYAVLNDGRLFAFGDNISGKLGDGGTTDKLVPTMLNVTGIIDVDAADTHTIALKSDGTVLGWGLNTNGQVGNGTTVTQKTPAQVLMANGQPLANVEAIDAGGLHSHALLSDGTVWSWGFNSNRELGIGNTTAQRFATQSFSPSLFAPPEPVDTLPPTISLTASLTTPTSTDITINATITDDKGVTVQKWAVGNQTASYFASQGNTLTGSSFVVSANGTYTVYAKDEAGNETVQTITISNIDKIAPTIALTRNGNVIQVTATDANGVKSIKLPNGSVVNGSTASYTITQNGTFTFEATDNANNIGTQSITISDFDTIPPADATFTASTTNPTNGNVTITINFPSDAVIKEYKVGSGAWTTYSSPVVMSENRAIYARSKDAAGNLSNETSYNVTNIDKIAPGVATFTADKTTETSGNVTVTITYPSDGAVKQYKIGSTGTWTNYTAPVVMTTNGTIYARSTDAAGNTSAESNYVVSNIDKTAPGAATFSADKTTPTNGSVNVTITFPSDASVKQYKIGATGTWTTYTTPVVMTANGTIFARSSDTAGNISPESSYEVNNIDKTAPGPATFTADKTTATNGSVNVTITFPSDASIKQYKIGESGIWTAYTSPVAMNDNGTIYARSSDAAGNQSVESSYNVTNIDKTAPGAATFSADKTTLTNGNVTVTITFPSDASVRQYKIGATGTWTTYSSPVVMTSNGTIYARSSDAAGNVSVESSYNVTNIDKVAPEKPVITSSNTEAAREVTISIAYPSDAAQKQVKIGSGEWTTYTSPIVLSANATVYARAIDGAGNISPEATLNVLNVDSDSPDAPVFVSDIIGPTNSNVTITIEYSNDSTVREYKIGENGVWTAYTTAIVMTGNGTIYARSADAVGNQSDVSIFVVDNIDKTPPSQPVIIVDKTSPTNGTVLVTINFPADAVIKHYSIGNGAFVNYTGPFVISENTTIKADAHDAVGNVSSVASYVISNIDKVAPTGATFTPDTTTPTSGNVKVTINYPSDATVKEYKIGESGTWMPYTSAVIMSDNGTIYTRSKDAAGNQSVETSFEVNNIDNLAPVAPTLTVDKTSLTNSNVLVTIVYPTDAATKQYKIGTSGTWVNYTTPVVISTNTIVYARATDASGNVSEEASITISNIDKDAPTAPTFTPVEGSNSVQVTINYSADSIVKEYKIGSTGAWTAYTSPITMSENGTIFARSKDEAGNVSAESRYEVTTIDNVAPDAPTIVADVTAPTNSDVKVTITYPSDAAQKQYKLGNGVWVSYNSPITISANNTVYARAIDAAGNISEESRLVISNIDKTAPTAPTFDASESATQVTLAINYSADSTVKEYKIGSTGTWKTYSSPIVLTENVTVYARSKDSVGNMSSESRYEVTSIDDEAPAEATFEVSPTSPTKDAVTVKINYPSDATVKEYRIGSTGTWIAYTSPLAINSNTTVYARSSDAVGNMSNVSSVVVDNIDNVAPTKPVFSLSTTAPTSQPVIVTISFPSDANVREYKVGEGQWMSYTSPLSIPFNTTVYARAIDVVGNISEIAQTTINNISSYDGSRPVTKEDLQQIADPAVRDQFLQVLTKVEMGENYPSYNTTLNAVDAFNTLPLEYGTDPLYSLYYNDLYKRVEAIKFAYNLGLAETAVEQYERFKTNSYRTRAQNAVNVLPDSPEKTALQARIDAVANG